jgi:hypothetical protein
MSVLLTANQIAERALRKIGSFPITETAARPEELAEALFWLDLIIASLPSEVRRYWLLSDTLHLPLLPGTEVYRLADLPDWPAEGVEHVTHCWLEDPSGNRSAVAIVGRTEFDLRSRLDTPGRPELVHIDRSLDPKLRAWPVIAVADFRLGLIVQKLGPDLAPRDSSPRLNRSHQEHGLPATWQMWAVNELAIRLGDGPVRKLAGQTIAAWKAENLALKADLDAFQDAEHQNTPPITMSMDIC